MNIRGQDFLCFMVGLFVASIGISPKIEGSASIILIAAGAIIALIPGILDHLKAANMWRKKQGLQTYKEAMKDFEKGK